MSKFGRKWKQSKWFHLKSAIESMEVNDVLQWVFSSGEKPATIRTIIYRAKLDCEFSLSTTIGAENRIFIIRLA